MSLTNEQLKEIEDRVKTATKGPWEDCYKKGKLKNWVSGSLQQENGQMGWPVICSGMTNYDNSVFIAHARQDIPDLLAHISELETTNQQLLTALQDAISKPMGVVPDSAIPFIW